MFREDFIWGVASSAYQTEGTDPEDGRGKCVWDTFTEQGRVYEQQDALHSCDLIHRYRDDFDLMKNLGIRNYRFSLSWARIMPEGTGRVNQKAISLYRDMIIEMKKRNIRPWLTLFHWEYPEALQKRGGWLHSDSVKWFGEYARVAAENFADLCDDFITINEPQCVIGLGYLSGVHAPGLKLSVRESLLAAHHLMMAHGQAVLELRKYAGKKIRIGYAPTCGVAFPATDTPEDIQAAQKVYFGFYQPLDNWTWNVTWFSDPVFLGKYPEEGLKKFQEYLPEIKPEDLELIHQPIDFMGQNIYNGYQIRAGKDGEPEVVAREPGYARTASDWPVVPESLYYGIRFLSQRYHMPLYITENGVSCADLAGFDGKVHDAERIVFLDAYLSAIQKAYAEGADIRGYFLWTFLDNFEWADGYKQRFGIVHVDFRTQVRTVKDSAFWYQKVIESKGDILSVNQKEEKILFLNPVCTHNIWGGTRLREEYGYPVSGDDIGECWGVSAHPNGDGTIRDGIWEGKHLSEVWKEHPEFFGNLALDRFPLLTKIIDAREDLSIQVHPNDEYAGKHENGSLGKTECWYILDCKENATLVIGHHAQTREELKEMIEQSRWSDLIREIPIKKGDFIQIDPGTVHAIKGGTLLLETQQNSDITYRVYDYGRLSDGKPRPLHIRQSIDVITVPAKPAQDCVRTTDNLPDNTLNLLYTCKYYKIFKMTLNQKITLEQNNPFLILTVLEGSGIINSRPLKKGDHLIIPGSVNIIQLQGNMEMIASTVNQV